MNLVEVTATAVGDGYHPTSGQSWARTYSTLYLATVIVSTYDCMVCLLEVSAFLAHKPSVADLILAASASPGEHPKVDWQKLPRSAAVPFEAQWQLWTTAVGPVAVEVGLVTSPKGSGGAFIRTTPSNQAYLPGSCSNNALGAHWA